MRKKGIEFVFDIGKGFVIADDNVHVAEFF
jgi:hypothetical protein